MYICSCPLCSLCVWSIRNCMYYEYNYGPLNVFLKHTYSVSSLIVILKTSLYHNPACSSINYTMRALLIQRIHYNCCANIINHPTWRLVMDLCRIITRAFKTISRYGWTGQTPDSCTSWYRIGRTISRYMDGQARHPTLVHHGTVLAGQYQGMDGQARHLTLVHRGTVLVPAAISISGMALISGAKCRYVGNT